MARRTLLARKLDHGAYDLYQYRDDRTTLDAPRTTALSFAAVFDHVVFGRHDALVVEDDARRTYFPIAFAVPTGETRCPTDGACVLLRPEAGLSEAYLRGWTHAMKGVLGDAIDAGRATPAEVRECFLARVEAFEATTEVIVP